MYGFKRRDVTRTLIRGGGGGGRVYSYFLVLPNEFLFKFINLNLIFVSIYYFIVSLRILWMLILRSVYIMNIFLYLYLLQ